MRILFAFFATAVATACAPRTWAADPVTDFIVAADQALQDGGETALAAYVGEHPLLVGAAVAQLLDVAIDLSQQGEEALAAENVAFAEQVAAIHEARTGSSVVQGLVTAYRERNEEQWAQFRRAKELEAQAAEAREGGDPDRGVELLKQALGIYAEIGAAHDEAVAWGTLGVFEWGRGDLAAVREAYEKAIVARRAVEDRILEGRTLNGLGSTCLQLGEYDAAIDYYEQAKQLREATGDLDGLGTTLTYLGNTYYVLGKLVLARKHFEQALPILESQGRLKSLAELYNGIGNLHSGMGRYDEAAEAYAKVIEIAQEIDAPDDEMNARINVADNLRLQGRFTEAIAELERAQALEERVNEPTTAIALHATRGQTFSLLGDLDRAREDLVMALRLSQERGLPGLQIEALINVGELYRSLLANDRALDAAQKAITLAAEQGEPRRYRDANALAGDVARTMGDLEAARGYWSEALSQDEADGAAAMVPESELGLAGVEALSGETEVARERYRRAWSRLETAGKSALAWVPALGIGHTFEQADPDSAAHYYGVALDALESKRVSDAALGTGFVRADRSLAYEGVVRYFADNWMAGRGDAWKDRSFAVAERMKARSLLDLVGGAAPTGTIPGMQALLDSLYSLPEGPDARQKRFRLEEQMASLRENHLERALGATPAAAAPASLQEVRERLPKGALLLEYALGDSASYLWAVDRKASNLVELPPRPALAASVERLRAAIEARGGADATLRQEARSLHRLLLEPVADAVRRAEVVVVVPDEILFALPFEVLLSADAPEDAAWDDLAFVGKETALVYAPSATVWLDLRERSGDHDLQLLAVGDPLYAEGSGLVALPHSREEVEAIGSFVKPTAGEILLGASATETALKAALRAQAPRVLHLATHGLIDAAEPSRSSIALTPSPEEGDDGHLYSLEVFSLSLDDALVVLSACESARGRVQRGEGVVGLTRAFLGAGASAVVASLWPVSDASTSALMRTFYQKMFEKHRSAAKALQGARVAMLAVDETAHPFHWAPFVVVGSDLAPW